MAVNARDGAGVPRLVVVAELALAPGVSAWRERLAALSAALPPWAALQVRCASAPAAERTRLLSQARQVTRGGAARTILNGSCEEAIALGFDAVHLPERTLSADLRLPGGIVLAGASIHDGGALSVLPAAVAYLHFGPVYSPTWKDAVARGLRALGEVARRAPVPVLAIGGITPARVGDCIASGAWGVAVASGIAGQADPLAALERYTRALDEAYHRRPQPSGAETHV